MPTSERYSRYREDQTTIWVSKSAAEFLSRERNTPGEGAAAVLDRVLNENKRMRKASGGGTGAGGGGGATKGGATKGGATKAGAGTRGTKSASRSAAKGGAKTARRA
jgi:hypothetical protein